MSHLTMFAGALWGPGIDHGEIELGPIYEHTITPAATPALTITPPRPPTLGDLGFDWEEPAERAPRRRRLELVVVDPIPLWPELPDRLVSLEEQAARRARRPFDQERDA